MATGLYDVLSSFEAGMNGGVQPLLLSKNQLALLKNGTVRGAYVTHRQPKRKQRIFVDGFEVDIPGGFFQGAGVYRPDSGATEIIAQISGRIIRYRQNAQGWDYEDITIPGDLNSLTATQAWLWQSEKWMIISDGSGKLPIIYDGVSCRRSFWPSAELGTVVGKPDWATDATKHLPPPIGEEIVMTLGAAFKGRYGFPVLFNDEFYEPIPNVVPAVNYNAVLTHVSGTVPTTYPVGTEVIENPSAIATIANIVQVFPTGFGTIWYTFTVAYSGPTVFAIGQTVIINGVTFVVALISGNDVQFNRTGALVPCNVGDQITVSGVPAVSHGTIQESDFVSNGGSQNIVLSESYSGEDGVTVFINGDRFTIAKYVPAAPTNSIRLKNLSDTSASVYADNLVIRSVPELPSTRMGVYGHARNWPSLVDGMSFIGGDIVGGAAGTVANNYRDSVLKTTENTFLESRGSFRLPGAGNVITSMTFMALLDQTLGQGPLMIGTAEGIFACQVPTDRSTWASLETPILPEVLLGLGPTGQNSTLVANNDMFFRTQEGIATLQMARRDFTTWGNVPISREVETIIKDDDKSLLQYGSAILFDNRLLMTTHPTLTDRGVLHTGCVALNFDAISNLRGKLPPVYDGYWNDLKILQFVTGNFNGTRRAFYFGADENNVLILNELLAGDTNYLDDDTTRITFQFESPVIFNKDVKPLNDINQLQDGELYFRDIKDEVDVTVEYRPDFYPCWVPWQTFTLKSDPAKEPGYRTRIGLGEPSPDPSEPVNNRPLRNGHFFQIRVTVTGSCKVMGMRFLSNKTSVADFARPICNEPVVEQSLECDLSAP